MMIAQLANMLKTPESFSKMLNFRVRELYINKATYLIKNRKGDVLYIMMVRSPRYIVKRKERRSVCNMSLFVKKEGNKYL